MGMDLDLLAAGSRFAYRQKKGVDLVPVELVAIGRATGPRRAQRLRVKVRWLDDAFEGKVDWVPVGRLKCAWAEVESFLERDRNWAEVRRGTPGRGGREAVAIDIVCGALIDTRIADPGVNDDTGVITIRDVAALAELLDVPREFFGDEANFTEAGGMVCGWHVTERILKRGAERHPDQVLRFIASTNAGVSSDVREINEPGVELVKSWCSVPHQSLYDENLRLRDDLAELSRFAGDVLAALREQTDMSKRTRESMRVKELEQRWRTLP
ncbi:hypothetical protein A5N78_20640 [Prescottella equi]|uniref:hypothetical protein n=1 Tax=Rhodococcus hoagii TaxID=43767 RepID=UPI000A10B58A|nr:hypothetical protein [Prescottella equi]ORL86115.1 hypothetical protein A5N78_20640 [Prescottella equi]ORM13196.1 hypothetical protein A5N70_20910 [Prescottella equi]